MNYHLYSSNKLGLDLATGKASCASHAPIKVQSIKILLSTTSRALTRVDVHQSDEDIFKLERLEI